MTALEGGNRITFDDPRQQIHILAPEYEEVNQHNCVNVTSEVNDGLLLLFPSWLVHSVPRNNSGQRRISISYNINFTDFTGRISPPKWQADIDTHAATGGDCAGWTHRMSDARPLIFCGSGWGTWIRTRTDGSESAVLPLNYPPAGNGGQPPLRKACNIFFLKISFKGKLTADRPRAPIFAGPRGGDLPLRCGPKFQ